MPEAAAGNFTAEPEVELTLHYLNTIFPAISMICAMITIGIFFAQEEHNMYWHLIVVMACSDIMAAVGDFLLWGADDRLTCLLGALAITFFDWASVAWVGGVVHFMWRVIVVPRPITRVTLRQLAVGYHVAVWGSSTILTLLPLVDGFEDGAWPKTYGHE